MPKRDWTRRYPPVLAVVVAVVLALAVLPSALVLPQTNPATTLEYAPVPPSDDAPRTGRGNVASLGLATSGSVVAAGDSGDGVAGAGALGGVGKNPRTKRCVGSPPRQTEDPLSPPCVAYFAGDNGGGVHHGVTRDEVRVLVYLTHSGGRVTSRGAEGTPPANSITDLAAPPRDDDTVDVRMLKLASRYFNDRYQTYGRFVHMWLHRGSQSDGASTPEVRRADAAEGYSKVRPFAVMNPVTANSLAYTTAMTDRGVVVFLGKNPQELGDAGAEAASMRRTPGLMWSYFPSIDERAAVFADYVCAKVVGHAASYSGNLGENGNPRKLGLYRAQLQSRPDLALYARLIRERVERCGGRFVGEAVLTSQANRGADTNQQNQAAQEIARFRQLGVTTIVWAAGSSTYPQDASQATGYRPEWVVASDNGWSDTTLNGQLQPQDVWSHARVVTIYTYADSRSERPCVQAADDVDPSTQTLDVDSIFCPYYDSLRMIFTGLQVAGPRLSPPSMDKGYHAIPAVASVNPAVPACFYRADDYSCVKDAAVGWWDPTGRNHNATTGCWRMMQRGRRYLAGTWPSGDVETMRRPDDPCNVMGVHPAGG